MTVNSFTEFNEETDYQDFLNVTIDVINEGFVGNISSSLNKKIEFVKSAAKLAKKDLKEVLAVFKERKIYKFFASLKWSFDKLLKLLRTGYKAYGNLMSAFAEFMAKNPVVKWSDGKIKELDAFLKKHPKTARLAGVAIAGLLVYVWFSVGFSGDFSTDFDMSSILDALAGTYTLYSIFGGSNGIKMIALLTAGAFSVSFPWMFAAKTQFVSAIIGTLIIRKKKSSI
ncbi:MAG: hypothetical protein R8M45_05470 [Ghiorsea sp.]